MRKYVRFRLTQWLSEQLPTPQALALAVWLADWQWRRSAIDREAVRVNLSALLGRPVSGNAPEVREVFRHFARYLYEFFTMHRVINPSVTVGGQSHLTQAHQAGRGAIILTGHVGNWELGAVLLRRMGFEISAVALPHDEPRLNRLFDRQRSRCGVEVIPVGAAAARQGLEWLKAGRLLGVLGDRDFIGDGLPLPLGAGRSRLPRGPALLSLRSGAPVVPTFLLREGMWKFRLQFEPAVWPTHGRGITEAVGELTASYAAVLGRYLQRYPQQWLMFQPVFLT